jgi:hypothetical protein
MNLNDTLLEPGHPRDGPDAAVPDHHATGLAKAKDPGDVGVTQIELPEEVRIERTFLCRRGPARRTNRLAEIRVSVAAATSGGRRA